jgi:hypothetical protein
MSPNVHSEHYSEPVSDTDKRRRQGHFKTPLGVFNQLFPSQITQSHTCKLGTSMQKANYFRTTFSKFFDTPYKR